MLLLTKTNQIGDEITLQHKEWLLMYELAEVAAYGVCLLLCGSLRYFIKIDNLDQAKKL